MAGVGTEICAPNLFACRAARSASSAAGDAGREAEVVLDAHAPSGLAARPDAFQHDRIQPLGGAVDRRGQPRRPGPDHDQVVRRLLQRAADAQGIAKLAVRGIAEDQLVAPGDHGGVVLAHAEPLQQLLHLRIGLEVEPRKWHPVLGQEFADTECVPGVARADHADAHELAGLAQELAAGDERLHDDVAQVGVVVDELAQGLGRHLVDFAIPPGDGIDDRRAARQLGHVAGELPGPLDRDGPRGLPGFVHDLDLARLDDEELEVPVTDLEELFPIPVLASFVKGQRSSAASWDSSSLGKATDRKSCSAMLQPPPDAAP